MKRRVAIIGGGISGLTAAYVLQRDHAESCDVTLFEASERLGGIVETVHTAGFTIECGPDSWVSEKPWAAQLAVELGLGDDLLPSSDHQRRTWIAQRGQLAALPDAMRMMVPTDLDAMARSPLFSPAARDAYRSEPSRANELRATALLTRGGDESVAAFVERHFGEEVVHTVAGPLLAGIFGGDIHKLSARALLAPFIALEAEQGSLIRALQLRPASAAPIFTTLAGGLGTLIERMAQRIPATCILRSTPVQRLRRHDVTWMVESASGPQPYDFVVIATPLDTTRHFLASLDLAEAQQAATLLPAQAASGLIVALGYAPGTSAPLSLPSGFGLLVAPEPDEQSSHHAESSLLACTFLHQKFAHRAPPDATLLRAFFSSASADQLSTASDEQIAATARDQLSALIGPLPVRADITVVRRWPRSLPQYEVGHVDRMARYTACLQSIPRLSVIGNAVRGVGLPDLIRDATAAAHAIAAA